MEYRDTWDLTTIPDVQFDVEYLRRLRLRRGPNFRKQKMPKERRMVVDQKSEMMRRLRDQRRREALAEASIENGSAT